MTRADSYDKTLIVMIEEMFFCLARFAFDLAAPLLEAERRYNWNTCDVVDELDRAILRLEQR